VPTTAVGTRVFTGYSRAALDLGLDEAGYPPRAGVAADNAAPADGDAASSETDSDDESAAAN